LYVYALHARTLVPAPESTSRSSKQFLIKFRLCTLYREERIALHSARMRFWRGTAAAYPQVLIAQRTFFNLQTNYIFALESVWINSITLQGLLLTDGLDLPSAPGEIDRSLREINMPVTEIPGARQ
jgi:hypothetical protein